MSYGKRLGDIEMVSKCPYCGSKDITDIIIDAPIDFYKPMHEQAFGNFPICGNCGRNLRARQAEPANDNEA